jgi:hypothetical protein
LFICVTDSILLIFIVAMVYVGLTVVAWPQTVCLWQSFCAPHYGFCCACSAPVSLFVSSYAVLAS